MQKAQPTSVCSREARNDGACAASAHDLISGGKFSAFYLVFLYQLLLSLALSVMRFSSVAGTFVVNKATGKKANTQTHLEQMKSVYWGVVVPVIDKVKGNSQ